MKLTFLGTSAGENYPALWCHCPNCEYARTHGGKNIRQNSCAVLDGDILIDFSHHIFQSALLYGVDITRAQVLLCTHNHKDHLYSHHLIWRNDPMDVNFRSLPIPERVELCGKKHFFGSRMTDLPFLDIYGHESVYQAICENDRYRPEHAEDIYHLSFHPLSRGEAIVRDDLGLRFTAVTSRHSKPGSTYNYIIERDGRTLLYALDCGGYDDDMLELLKQYRYDCVVLEGTFGLMEEELDMHQNLNKNLRYLAFLNENHLWNGAPRMILSHMAPHWTPPHDFYVEMMKPFGIEVAYDGLTIEI